MTFFYPGLICAGKNGAHRNALWLKHCTERLTSFTGSFVSSSPRFTINAFSVHFATNWNTGTRRQHDCMLGGHMTEKAGDHSWITMGDKKKYAMVTLRCSKAEMRIVCVCVRARAGFHLFWTHWFEPIIITANKFGELPEHCTTR